MDKVTFKNTFLPLGEKLYIIAFRLLNNKMEAEDMVQETYLKLWNKRDELDGIKSPTAFAITVLKNLTLDYINSSGYKFHNNEVEIDNYEDINVDDRNLENKEAVRTIYSIINHLSPPQKQVIILRHIKGLSLEEIEKVTGLSPVNVRVQLSRARKKLKEQFNIYQN